ncbi:MAG: hypothetical protein ABI432_17290 [Flavobacteriales bacterium]
MIRVVSPLLFFVLTLPSFAQKRVVQLADADLFLRNPDLSLDRGAIAGMQAAGLQQETIDAVMKGSDAKNWPVGLRTDSAMHRNHLTVRNYAAVLICEYNNGSENMSIVSVASNDNHHMPEELRSPEDIYFVVRAGGVAKVQIDVRPTPSMGPSYKRMDMARILDPEKIYATYNLGRDTTALGVLARRGMSKPEIDAVVFRSTERNWPDGIASFEKRYPRLADFKKYKAYQAARWNDLVLLVIPAAENQKMPQALRPFIDIYMVFAVDAVQVKEKK